MKIAKRSADSDLTIGRSGGITADNYSDRCVGFIKGRGGKGFVIRAIEGEGGSLWAGQPATEPQWIAWMEYFAEKEIPHTYARTRGMTTVPCEWPEDFDYEAPQSNSRARLPQPKPRASPEQRQATRRRMEALAAQMANKDHRRKRTDVGAMSVVEAERHLDQLSARYAAEPCAPLSGCSPVNVSKGDAA